MDDARRHRRVKQLLSEKLSLSTKLRLKRLVFAPVRWTLRLAARAYNFAGRVGESAEANGLDVRRAWDVRARERAPHAVPWGASDFVFLNNDTVVLPGWLKALVETIERDERAGAVGSLFLYPDGRIQEAGAILWSNGEAFHYGWGRSPDDRRFTFAREVDYCSGASLLVRKDLFQRLGGSDRRYAPAYYEDADIAMGVRSLGYEVVYQPLSRLVQHESATDDTDARTGP